MKNLTIAIIMIAALLFAGVNAQAENSCTGDTGCPRVFSKTTSALPAEVSLTGNLCLRASKNKGTDGNVVEFRFVIKTACDISTNAFPYGTEGSQSDRIWFQAHDQSGNVIYWVEDPGSRPENQAAEKSGTAAGNTAASAILAEAQKQSEEIKKLLTANSVALNAANELAKRQVELATSQQELEKKSIDMMAYVENRRWNQEKTAAICSSNGTDAVEKKADKANMIGMLPIIGYVFKKGKSEEQRELYTAAGNKLSEYLGGGDSATISRKEEVMDRHCEANSYLAMERPAQ